MSAVNPQSRSYSADVRLELHLAGHILPIAQLGPDFFTLRTPIDHPPGAAEISMSIDGHVSRWAVRLVDGISVLQRRTRISAC